MEPVFQRSPDPPKDQGSHLIRDGSILTFETALSWALPARLAREVDQSESRAADLWTTQAYTQTAVPIGVWPVAHIQSIAALLTRAQPCDAG